MKNLFFVFFFSFLFHFALNAQVMHSPNAMEYSIGGEQFSQFVAQNAVFPFGGGGSLNVQEVYRWRPSVTARYKKFLNSGNYFGFGLQAAYSEWTEEVLVSSIPDFEILVGSLDFPVFEENQEVKFSGSYQYSFLINKETDNNFQFFIGGGAELYTSFANKSETDFFFFPFLRRNILGLRVTAIPEIMYLVPNSRITVSLRGVLPIADLQRIQGDLRQSTFSSFSQSRILTNDFILAPILRSRFELGLGYFLQAN